MNIAGPRGLSMMFFIAWIVILGFFMLRKAKSKIDSKIDGVAKKNDENNPPQELL